MIKETYKIRTIRDTVLGFQAILEREGVVVAFIQESGNNFRVYWVDKPKSPALNRKPEATMALLTTPEELKFEACCHAEPPFLWNGETLMKSSKMVIASMIYDCIFENNKAEHRKHHLKLL